MYTDGTFHRIMVSKMKQDRELRHWFSFRVLEYIIAYQYGMQNYVNNFTQSYNFLFINISM